MSANIKNNKRIIGLIGEGSRNPFVDWGMIIIVSFILSILMIANGIYVYRNVSNDNDYIGNISTSAYDNVLDTKVLDQVINNFDRKVERFNEVKKGFQSIADPSL